MTEPGFSTYLRAVLDASRDYFLFCGIAFVVFYVVLRRWLATRKIAQTPTNLRAPLAEIGRTLVSNLFGKGPIILALAYLAYSGIIPRKLIYKDVAEHGWAYFALTILFDVLVFDLWFYLSHRFLWHTRFGYRHIHIVHHRSVDPTPFARNSLHPIEGAANSIFQILPIFVMPHHPLAILISSALKGLQGVIAHLGYEIYRSGFTRHWLGRYIVTPVHHHLHHAKNFQTHFSFLINWDRIFGTQVEGYDEAFEATVTRERPEVSP